MTEAVYTATAEYIVEMEQRPVKHHVSVSGVLKHLGVSRSGYNAWKKKQSPSATEKHRGRSNRKSEKSMKIPTRTMEPLRSQGNCGKPRKIAVKTVANYMRQDGNQSPMGKAICTNNHRF